LICHATQANHRFVTVFSFQRKAFEGGRFESAGPRHFWSVIDDIHELFLVCLVVDLTMFELFVHFSPCLFGVDFYLPWTVFRVVLVV
jgi:hypothetical protein